MLTVLKKQPVFGWLNAVSSVPMHHLETAYRNFFQRRARYPQFGRKDGLQSAEFNKSAFNYRKSVLKLAKMAEPLNAMWSRDLPSAPTTITVTREADGRWSVSCRVVAYAEMLTGDEEAGIDLGLKNLVVLSTIVSGARSPAFSITSAPTTPTFNLARSASTGPCTRRQVKPNAGPATDGDPNPLVPCSSSSTASGGLSLRCRASTPADQGWRDQHPLGRSCLWLIIAVLFS
ncbi:transposase [Azospirillum sp. B21]|nr:transposase [Azospirillum sp. B21]